jgi:hypothetical protein
MANHFRFDCLLANAFVVHIKNKELIWHCSIKMKFLFNAYFVTKQTSPMVYTDTLSKYEIGFVQQTVAAPGGHLRGKLIFGGAR